MIAGCRARRKVNINAACRAGKIKGISAISAFKGIVPGVHCHGIIAASGDHMIIPGTGQNGIVARTGINPVGVIITNNGVLAIGGGNIFKTVNAVGSGRVGCGGTICQVNLRAARP